MRTAYAMMILFSLSSSLYATDRLANPSNFLSQFNAAQPGDRIIVAPGTYSRYWLAGKSGTANAMIQVVAQDPANRPVFSTSNSECLQIASCSYMVFDGLIVQGATTEGVHLQDAGSGPSNHVIMRNTSVTMAAGGSNTDNFKCDYTSDMLFYNCAGNVNADTAFDNMGVVGQLFMRCYSSGTSFAHAKNGSHNVGFYKNTLNNTGERDFQFGGNGVQNYDQIAMGNIIYGASPQSVVYTTAYHDEFRYNTIQNLDSSGSVIRMLNEDVSPPDTSYDTFSNNLVNYTGIAMEWPGGGTQPSTFTVANNFWSKTPDFSRSGGSMTETGGVVGNPQLDADYRPLNPAAKNYGANAPGMEAAWASYTNRFAWAWSYASNYDPNANAGTTYKVYKKGNLGGSVTVSGLASYAGNNPNAVTTGGLTALANYHQNAITAYSWDLNGDNVFGDATGGTATVTYAQLAGYGRGAAGTYPIELRITAHTDYGDIPDWAMANVVVADAHDGDANFDGRVDVVDLGVLAKNYDTASGADWTKADFNNDGAVDVVDLGVLAKNYDWVDTPAGEVPEPATLSLLALAGLAMLRRRK